MHDHPALPASFSRCLPIALLAWLLSPAALPAALQVSPATIVLDSPRDNAATPRPGLGREHRPYPGRFLQGRRCPPRCRRCHGPGDASGRGKDGNRCQPRRRTGAGCSRNQGSAAARADLVHGPDHPDLDQGRAAMEEGCHGKAEGQGGFQTQRLRLRCPVRLPEHRYGGARPTDLPRCPRTEHALAQGGRAWFLTAAAANSSPDGLPYRRLLRWIIEGQRFDASRNAGL